MISLIVCSVNPLMLEEFKQNVRETIGVENEIIVFDNRNKHWGLCKVYNYCMKNAQYPYLCFVHEDMYFFTKNWGKILIDFFSNTPKCGVIGFAGANYIDRTFVQWKIDRSISRVHTCISPKKELPVDYDLLNRFYNCTKDFERVIVLDGMFLFTSKDVATSCQFDEAMLDNFHIYDTDFTFSVSKKYNNYVCSKIDNMHRSHSSFSKSYLEGLMAFHEKRRKEIPCSIYHVGKLHSWLIKNHEILEFSASLKSNSYTEEQQKFFMDKFYSNFRVNNLHIIINYVYGKIMNIKIRKIRHFSN